MSDPARLDIPKLTEKQVEATLSKLEGTAENLTNIALELEVWYGAVDETDRPLVPIVLRVYQSKRHILTAVNQVRDLLERLELSG